MDNEQNKINEEELEEAAGGAQSYIYYTVVAGDTLTRIAAWYHTTVKSICRLNPKITNPDLIRVGWVLKIPQ